jgi:hypothetical protein
MKQLNKSFQTVDFEKKKNPLIQTHPRRKRIKIRWFYPFNIFLSQTLSRKIIES